MIIIFPNWLYPHNLGDSIQFCFVPSVLRQLNIDFTIITTGDLAATLKSQGYDVSSPSPRLLNISPSEYIKLSRTQSEIFPYKVIYPEWHPETWTYWNNNYEFLSNHPTANIITLNYLLQLGLTYLLKESPVDFTPVIKIDVEKSKNLQVGIVPDTKVANRGTPHPGCNGIGYRLNGPKGRETWESVCRLLRGKYPSIHIVEFSREFLGLGDEHFPNKSFLDTARKVKECNYGIMSDGGMHHVFISQKTPTLLLKGQIISHPDFTRVATDNYFPELDSKCLSRCNFKNMTGWADANKNCNLDCETLDPNRIVDCFSRIVTL